MDNVRQFFSKYLNALGASETERKSTYLLVDALTKYDPFNKTKFEVSFKITRSGLLRRIRFLNMDADAYSCKNQQLFIYRLNLYKRIVWNKIINPIKENLFRGLEEISNAPLDLYFGADIYGRNFNFAFWLIFGGVKKTGEVNFCNYDVNYIIGRFLEKSGVKKPPYLKGRILNLGFDIDNNNIFYKFYYLLKDKGQYCPPFNNLIKNINTALSDFNFFYFTSEMYNRKWQHCKTKLFIEFLDDIYPNRLNTKKILTKVMETSNNYTEPQKLFRIINSIGGRLSLISFERDGTLTFYIRPAAVLKNEDRRNVIRK